MVNSSIRTTAFGNIAARQVDTVYCLEMNLEKNVNDLLSLSRELIAECESIVADGCQIPSDFKVSGYGALYDLPIEQIAAYLFQEAGLRDEAEAAAKQPDPQGAMLEVARISDIQPVITEENAGAIIVALLVLFTNIESMRLHSVSIGQLLSRVADGDDDALFHAVVLDASVLQTKAASDRISTAAFHDDRSFFDKLSKAITRTKPSRPKPHLDETRFLMQILDDAGEYDGMTDTALTDWAVIKTGVHPGAIDPLSSVRDQRRKRDRLKGGP